MKRRMWIVVLALSIVFLILGVSPTALAGSPKKLTGGMVFVADWGDRFEVWQRYDVHQIDPWIDDNGVLHNARGQVNYKIYNDNFGWRHVQTTAVCVAFGEDADGTPMATTVLRIDRVLGWGTGNPGEHTKFFIRDGGTAGRMGDQWSMQYYDWYPDEFWPADELPPDCTYEPEDPDSKIETWWDITRGNLTIH
jgi:hypothetical protein